MNLLDFGPVHESIVKHKRTKFISHYCILRELIILPELIVYILQLEMDDLFNKLYNLIEDEKFLITVMIIIAKMHKKGKHETLILFNNEVESKYDEMIELIIAHYNTFVLNSLHKFDINPLESLYKNIPINTLHSINLYDVMIEAIQKANDNISYYVGTGIIDVEYIRRMILGNPNFKTKEKHLQHIIINL